ncbi:MAG: methyltransferase [Candidatus Binatia bacterium]
MDFSELSRLASSHVEARIIQVAVTLGIFDLLNSKNLDATAVGRSLRANRRAMELLLNALVALGLLKKREHLYSLSSISATYLVTSSPKYFGDMILFESTLWDSWGALKKAVQTGKPVRPTDMFQKDPKETEQFIGAMHSLVRARGDAEILLEQLNLVGITKLLDIGSGPGTYPICFCRKYPGLRVTILDLPGTMKITERFVAAAGLGTQIKLVTGNYRTDPIPGTYQMVFLSNIIHGEGVKENTRLMAKIYPRLEAGGKIVLKDHVLNEDLTEPSVGAVFSLLMLLTTRNGRCYAFKEIKGWLETAGFEAVRHIPLPSPLLSSLVIGEKN